MAYDVIVLGSGPGGYPAAIRASQLGKKVAIIEKESLGGVCLNWGCAPSRTVLKSGELYEYAKHGAEDEIKVDSPVNNVEGVIVRSRSVADRMSRGIQVLFKENKLDVIMGYAVVTAPGKIE